MELIKKYQGSIIADSQASVTTSYGMTNKANESVPRSKVLNDALVDILTEAGVECEHRDGFLWICGVPVHFAIAMNANYYQIYFPFNINNNGLASSYASIFSGLNYNFRLRFIGYAESGFAISIGTYNTDAWNNSLVKFVKAKRVVTGEPVIVYGNSSTRHYGVAFNGDGMPKDIGRSGNGKDFSDGNLSYYLGLTADDTAGQASFPLVRQVTGPFVMDYGFLYPANCGLANAATAIASQIFVTIDGREFWLAQNYLGIGLLEKPTGDEI